MYKIDHQKNCKVNINGKRKHLQQNYRPFSWLSKAEGLKKHNQPLKGVLWAQ